MALSHRVERIQEQVREEVSQMLATEVRDPGVGLVTVTRAKVTGDLSLARVYWTIIGDAAERKKTHKALERADRVRPPPAGRAAVAAPRARGQVHLRRIGRGAGSHRADHPGDPRRRRGAHRRGSRRRRHRGRRQGRRSPSRMTNPNPSRAARRSGRRHSPRPALRRRVASAARRRRDRIGDGHGAGAARAGQGRDRGHRRHPAGVPAAVSRTSPACRSRRRSPRRSMRR